MSLKELSLPSVIDSSTADMAREFVVPALSASLRYDRGVGFFSSGWLRVVCVIKRNLPCLRYSLQWINCRSQLYRANYASLWRNYHD